MTIKSLALRHYARARLNARRIGRDNRAIALIETAITLPTLLLVSFGGLEIANLMLVHTRMSNIALAVADNASRIAAGSNLAAPQVREADVNDVFTGAQIESGTFDLNTRGRVILSSLEINPDGGQWIHWQRCYGALSVSSAYGPQGTGATGTAFPGMGDTGKEVRAGVGSPVMFVEISYNYQPVVLPSLYASTVQIDYEAAFAVRDARDTTQIYNPAPTATVRTCPGGTARTKRQGRGGGVGLNTSLGWGNN